MISWENAFCRARDVELDVLLDVEGDSLALVVHMQLSVREILEYELMCLRVSTSWTCHILHIDKSPAINILQ